MMYDLVEYRVVQGISDMVPTLLGTYEDVEAAQKAKDDRKSYVKDTISIINRAIKNHEPEQEIRNYVQCLRFNPFNVRGYRIIDHPEPKQKSKMRNRKVTPGSVSDRPQQDLVQPKLWDQELLDQDLWTEEPWC